MARKKIAMIGAGQILAAQRNLGDVVLFDVFRGAAEGKPIESVEKVLTEAKLKEAES